MQQILKYFLLWLPMVFIAILNGAVRDLWYTKYTGELVGRQISTVSLIVLFGIYIGLILKKQPSNSAIQAFLIGLFWLILTLFFEFDLGIIRGNTWTQMLYDYNIFEGRIWILILVWVALAPYTFYKLRK